MKTIKKPAYLVIVCISIISLVYLLSYLSGIFSSKTTGVNYEINYKGNNKKTISRDYALYYSWTGIAHYLSGEEEVYACNLDTDRCYNVSAEIANGDIETIYFDKGGKLNFGAMLDKNGEAEGKDQNGTTWSFEVDTHSPLYEKAIREWANTNDYIIK